MCSLLPDLVDKPLWALGLGEGRYVGHTLLFVIGVSAALFLWRRMYGAAALFGGLSHLLLDWLPPGGPPVPWLYPLIDYGFPDPQIDTSGFFDRLSGSIRDYFFLDIGRQLVWVAVVVGVLLACMILYRRFRKREDRVEE